MPLNTPHHLLHHLPYTRRQILRLASACSTLLLTSCVLPQAPTPSVQPDMPPTPSSANHWQPPTTLPITPNDAFYTMKYHPSPPPVVDLQSYRLAVTGEVGHALSLSIDELKAYQTRREIRTLECIGNPVGGEFIGNAEWVGLSLAELLTQADIRGSGRYLKLESLDGYHTGIPLDLAMHPHSLLVYQMNGEPLPAKHGYPLRCLFPGRYGQKQPKWLHRITVQRQSHTGHWEGQGWSDEAKILPNAIIQAPSKGAIRPPDFVVSGVALTDDSGLAQLEISVDDGVTWQLAELLRGPTPYAWVAWWLRVKDAAPGPHRLLARATDGNGHRQSRMRQRALSTNFANVMSVLSGTFPNGTNKIHSVNVLVR